MLKSTQNQPIRDEEIRRHTTSGFATEVEFRRFICFTYIHTHSVHVYFIELTQRGFSAFPCNMIFNFYQLFYLTTCGVAVCIASGKNAQIWPNLPLREKSATCHMKSSMPALKLDPPTTVSMPQITAKRSSISPCDSPQTTHLLHLSRCETFYKGKFNDRDKLLVVIYLCIYKQN